MRFLLTRLGAQTSAFASMLIALAMRGVGPVLGTGSASFRRKPTSQGVFARRFNQAGRAAIPGGPSIKIPLLEIARPER